MPYEIVERDGTRIAVISGGAAQIRDASSALDLAMSIRYETGISRLAIDKEALCGDFFILSTGLAGEILEKFIQYRIKMAVYGDFSCYTSKPLRDFIYESNHGSDFFFVPEREEALRLLLRTAGRE